MKSNLVLTFALFLSLVVSSMGTAHAQEPTGEEYVVQAGDWLAKIAREVYGDPLAYPAIVEATNARAAEDSSFAVIADPNLIEVGQKLWIPALRFVGMYTASLPAASSPGRDIVLFLSADGAAELSTDYLNGEAPIVEIGTWQEDAGGTATVSLTGRPGGPVYDQPDVINFQLEDGTLTTVEYDPAMYGSEGLSLEKQIFPGIYTALLPAASSPGRDITLMLKADNTAVRSTDYLNGEPPIVEIGTWADNRDGTATVSLTGRPDGMAYDQPDVVTYRLTSRRLAAVEYDQAVYGSEGLVLDRQPMTATHSNLMDIYKAMTPAASSPGIDITLFLNFDGTLRQAADYLNGEPSIVEAGTWRASYDGTATLTITGQEDRAYETPQTISLSFADGVLTTTPDEDAYGSLGRSYLSFGRLATGQIAVPYDAAEATGVLKEAGFPGIYKGFLPAASSPGRDITLFLNPEAQASLKTDYLNGEPLIVEVGTWEAGDDGSLTLTITGREDADYEAPKVISFEVVDGVLTTSPDEDAYGQAGLQLYRFEVIAMASTNQAMPSPAPAAAVSGTVTYLQRIALPPNAVVEVKLVDVSRQDVPATVLGEQIITNPGQVPIPFEIAYDPASIDPRFTYAVQARIMADGQLLFISDTVTPVITRGAPTSDVEIVVVPVGS